MKILLSPAKTQNFTEDSSLPEGKTLLFLKQTKLLSKVLKEISVSDFGKLMKISPKLSQQTYASFQNWKAGFANNRVNSAGEQTFKPAIYTFAGDVYKGFNLDSYSKADILYLENNLRIISGFYGLLTPLTNIRPYRLEMGTRLAFTNGKKSYQNLYDFWKDILTERLSNELKRNEIIINLASQEYSKAIDLKSFGDRVVNIDFKVMKDEKTKTIGIYAKRQRGEMANWLIKNRIRTVQNIKDYNNDGFRYYSSLSTDTNLTFIRK